MAMAITALIALLLVAAAPAVWAADHIVGGTTGWTLGYDYSNWASSETFTVGDNLVFNYDSSTHQVAEVSQPDYNSCSSSNSIKTYDDGNTKIALNKAGSMQFICPVSGHCGQGMKLSVNVVAASGNTPAPGGSTPTTPGTSTPPPSTTPGTPTSRSPPAGNGAVGVFGHMNAWLMGVLGTIVVAFMV